jgi:Beta-L-arabinofuranosidase, GH127
VNLFPPSCVTWKQGDTECHLTQKTECPTASRTELQLKTAKPESFTIYLRVLAWAEAKDAHCGEWQSRGGRSCIRGILRGDPHVEERRSVEHEIGMPLLLQVVDPQTPQLVELFATGNLPATFSHAIARRCLCRIFVSGLDGANNKQQGDLPAVCVKVWPRMRRAPSRRVIAVSLPPTGGIQAHVQRSYALSVAL